MFRLIRNDHLQESLPSPLLPEEDEVIHVPHPNTEPVVTGDKDELCQIGGDCLSFSKRLKILK